ncbi:peptidoglycan DD-metalloendopeptidase family protein [bacterium]|nr:peptidoglycan DD-metalloendopeptidase family protein [bacterium]
MATAALAVCWLWPSVGSTQEKDEPPAKQLREVERAIEAGHSRSKELDREAARIENELQQLQRTLVESARRAQGQEETVTELESRLDSYRSEERSILASLNARRSAIDKTLGALQRISRVPPTAMLAGLDNVTDAVRASVLLSAIVPELSAQAQTFRSELLALRQIRGEIIRRRARLDNAVDRLKREQIVLDRLIDRKSSLRSRTLAESYDERRQIAALSASARDLTNLIDRIEQRLHKAPDRLALRPPDTSKPFSAARGTLSLPARGPVVTRFGERSALGLRSQGISVATRAGAQVVAPYDGRIVFAGLFRRYGQLLIIAHGGGYHTLLAGFSSIDGVVGQWLLAGEPVGKMSRQEVQRKPELYIELRQGGEPMNPLLWLAATETKVSG